MIRDTQKIDALSGACSANWVSRIQRQLGVQNSARSLKTRAWIETHFGWIKATAGLRQVKQRGLARVEALFQFAMAASNLVRMPKLLAAGAVA